MAFGPVEGAADARVAPYDNKPVVAGSCNLFVGGLPTDSTYSEEQLKAKFSPFGTIKSCKVIRDFNTKVGKGCAFVCFNTLEEANKAIEGVNAEGEFQVKVADNEQGANKGKEKGKGKGKEDQLDNLYVKQIAKHLDQFAFEDFFKAQGFTVVSTKMLMMGEESKHNAAIIRLGSAAEAASAIEKMNGKPLPGTEDALFVALKTQKPDPNAQANNAWSGGGWEQPAAWSGGGWEQPAAEVKDNLYVKDIPASVDQAQLDLIFTSAGFTITRSKLLPARGEGEKSVAMVQLASEEQAAQAITKLNGQMPNGLTEPLNVSLKISPKGKGDGKGKDGKGKDGKGKPGPAAARPTGSFTLQVKYAGADAAPSDNLFVSGLPGPQLDMPTLKQLFLSIGSNVTRAKVIPANNPGGTSLAMVQLESQEAAAQCISALDGQTVSCEEIRAEMPNDAGEGGTTMTVTYQGPDQNPSPNLHVSGLPSPQVEISVLNQIFTVLGLNVVRSKPLPDTRGVGHSQALVQVESQEQAATAIAMLNGELFPEELQAEAGSGQPLTVKYQGANMEPSDNLYISGLPSPSVNVEILNSVFTGLGFTVKRSRVIADTRNSGSSSAMVQLGSKEEAAGCIEALNGQVVDGLKAEKVEAAPSWGDAGGKGAWDAGSGAWSTSGSDWSAGGWEDHSSGKGKGKMDLASLFAKGSSKGKDEGKGKDKGKGKGDGTGLIVKFAGKGEPSGNLYISGLPGTSIEQSVLAEMFACLQCTVIRSRVIVDTKGTGTCVAMVELGSQAEAQWAIDRLHGQPLRAEDLPGAAKAAAPAAAAAPAPQGVKRSAPGAAAGPLSVRYAGKAGADGTLAPSDYLTFSGFTGDLPAEADMKQILTNIGCELKRMRVMKGQIMLQVASVEQATKAIAGLNGWPLPETEEPWPECTEY